MIENKAQEIAWKVDRYIQEAVGELAYGYVMTPDFYGIEDLSKKFHHTLQSRDPAGSLADAFYNDDGMMCDLAGDRIYDEVKGNTVLFNEVLDYMPSHINWSSIRYD